MPGTFTTNAYFEVLEAMCCLAISGGACGDAAFAHFRVKQARTQADSGRQRPSYLKGVQRGSKAELIKDVGMRGSERIVRQSEESAITDGFEREVLFGRGFRRCKEARMSIPPHAFDMHTLMNSDM